MNTQYFLAYTQGEGDKAENVHRIFDTQDLMRATIDKLPRTQEFIAGPISIVRTFEIRERKPMGRKKK